MSPISTSVSYTRRIIGYYRDREYFNQLLELGVPISLQSLVMSSLNMVGLLMIGQKGDVAVAAVGLANQLFFLFTLTIFGITSGTAMFTAQLWGKRDIKNIRNVLGLSLVMSFVISIVFTILAEYFPKNILAIYSDDWLVIELGSVYLRIYGWSFLFYAITAGFCAVHRSIGNVRLPLIFNVFALSLNTLLSFILIFGKLGIPALGVQGAALAALISRIRECIGLLAATYLIKSPIAAGLKELTSIDLHFASKVLKPVIPVALNEFLWSMGITAYNVVYARIGTESIASINIINAMDVLAYVFFTGISNATAIMVGNAIGAGQEKKAYTYAGRSLGLSAISGIFVGGIVLFGSDKILELYKVTPIVIENSHRILHILGLMLWLRAMNSALVVGILRGGGDTKFCLFLDGIIIWIVGVPMAFTGAFILHLPVYWVYLMVMSEEICKWVFGMQRYFSRKWIHNLAQTIVANV